MLADLSKRMMLFAGLMIAGSLLSLLMTVFQLTQLGATGGALFGGTIATGIWTFFYIIIGIYTISAASSVSAIVTSQGEDGAHFIAALKSLKTLFGIQYWLIVIALIAIVLAIIGILSWMVVLR